MTPFEVRLELLKMAKEMIEIDYFAERERISNDWNLQCEVAKDANQTPPEHPPFPPFPSAEEIIEVAQQLDGFASFTVVGKPEKQRTDVKDRCC